MALFSAASIVPLYVGMATHEQADRLGDTVRARLLTPGGIMASEYETGEQWDKPNGWAPLQWMAIQGFKMYGDDALGDEIAHSWLQTVNQFYQQHHKIIEKYHIQRHPARRGRRRISVAGWLWLDQRRRTAPDWAVWRTITVTLSRQKWRAESLAISRYPRWDRRGNAALPARYHAAVALSPQALCRNASDKLCVRPSAAHHRTWRDPTY